MCILLTIAAPWLNVRKRFLDIVFHGFLVEVQSLRTFPNRVGYRANVLSSFLTVSFKSLLCSLSPQSSSLLSAYNFPLSPFNACFLNCLSLPQIYLPFPFLFVSKEAVPHPMFIANPFICSAFLLSLLPGPSPSFLCQPSHAPLKLPFSVKHAQLSPFSKK